MINKTLFTLYLTYGDMLIVGLVIIGVIIVYTIIYFISSARIKEEPIKHLEEKQDEQVQTVEEVVVSENVANDVEKAEPIIEPQIVLDEPEDTGSKSRRGKYEIFKDGEFYRFHLKASNGEVLSESDIYQSEQGATDAIEIIRKNAEVGLYKIYDSKNQMFQFSLSSRNHRILAVSSYYSTKKAATDACEAFKRNAVTDNIVSLGENIAQDSNMELFFDETQGTDATGVYTVLPNGKKFYFVLKAPNQMVICHSQDYVSKTSCITALESFREVVYDGSFYILKDKNDRFQFKLYTKTNKLLITSDTYDTRNRVVSSIKLIRRYAKLGKLDQ